MACSAEAVFAELHALSNFSFLRGASHPKELVAEAARLGYAALALTDECSLAGVVRAHAEAKTLGFKLIIGSEFRLEDGPKLVLLAMDRRGYGQLAAFITLGRRAAEKGEYRLLRGQLETHPLDHCIAIWLPEDAPDDETGVWLARLFPARCWIGVELFLSGGDGLRLSVLQALGERLGLPLVACNDVHMHARERQPLQDTLTAIRLGRPLAELGYALFPNGERHLRPIEFLARIYPRALLEESLRIAERCRFSLDELRYEYPAELVPDGYTAIAWLRELTRQGMAERWPEGAPDKVRRQVEHELELIGAMAYEPFFLTVHDVVRFARSRGILCQGRGSAANSAVCYCLGITEVDPARLDLLFERFISRERNEPPDIDVDFEHERREEVIQYIYRKYGRHRAALAASLITYRVRSAVRDVARALGFSPSRIDTLARVLDRHGVAETLPERLAEAGLASENPAVRRLLALVQMLVGFPRHLSQHVGGFVIAAEDLSHWVPVENAAMPERTVIQWDKDDLESLGLLKVDVLSLGMLTAIRKALAYVGEGRGRPFTLADVPPEDPAVYEMLQRADSIGVFQVESRAQMSMLPRLRPQSYYDLVIQIAIVRPGPIQGDMVHPYLTRRAGLEPVSYPSPAVEKVLRRTLGVPIFQEQVMQLAMVAAGFTPGEADRLRRAMAAWHRKGGLEPFEKKLMDGMRERGYEERFARQIYRQIRGFGEYGFPESHSASFALLAYVSAWLKCHHPAAFACALLNSQPMGFYGPSQLIQDARRHGVEVRPIDVNHSGWDCTLEPTEIPNPLSLWERVGVRALQTGSNPALRLGLRLVNGFSSAAAQRLSDARRQGPFQSVQDLATRARLDRRELEALAAADALHGLGGHRHRAFWEAAGVEAPTPLYAEPQFAEAEPLLRKPGEAEDVIADYAAAGASLRRHPLSLLRERLDRRGFRTAEALWQVRNGAIARVAGLVVCRQRPMTANGTTFVTIEDETGQINLIVWPATAQAQRRALLRAHLLAVSGTVQQEEGVLHLVAGRLEDIGKWLGGLVVKSRDFQ
ncbi:error-prone DNA polymerase [Methylococcus capsulatus]|jgi:error-prone DNA polymerase|uniref:error-prone DNA polymerase n=1 Tax=Methylococcus capsulatus TaxID=414 RepID=UPI00035F86E9|nr:error-prone DNA polymerase [Methylococcus capsulatus]